MKLALKFTLAFLVGMTAVLGVEAYATCQREIAFSRADLAQDQHVLGGALALSAARLWETSGREAAMDFLRNANRAEKQNRMSVVWIPLDTHPGEAVSRIAAADLAVLREGREVHHLELSDAAGGHAYTCVPLRVAGAVSGAVEIDEPLAGERTQIRSIVRGVALATFEVMVVSGVLALILGMRFVGRPVGALIRQAKTIATGDFSQQLRLRRHDEFQVLADEMDIMREQLLASKQRIQTEHAAKIVAIEQLRHADRLKTVGQLASGVAHELGTPLNVVSARAKLLQAAQYGEPVRGNARVITEQTERMVHIIRQLLDLARPHHGRQAVVRLEGLVRRTLAVLDGFARTRNVRLSMQVEGQTAACVDADQIQQVLSNLVMNGIQAMPEGGTLAVSVAREMAQPPAEVGGPEKEYLCLSVQDEGVGIDPDVMPRLFEPFFTTKDVGIGTGLGLSVSLGLVREHGGWIDVTSTPAHGSRFDVYLPEHPRRCNEVVIAASLTAPVCPICHPRRG